MTAKKIKPKNTGVGPLFKQISTLINEAKRNVQMAVNWELVFLYWNIGKAIKKRILKNQRADYGRYVVDELSKKLTVEYGDGYSRSNLFRMINLYETFPEKEIVATVSRQLSWSHLTEIIKIDDRLKREFFIQMCINEMWGVRTLKERINSMLYERTAISRKPEQTIANDLKQLKKEKKMSIDLFLKDPYILDFLEFSNSYKESDFEKAILNELEKFIIEMGTDFAFLARQKRITVDDEDYYIDLLFYHRKMRRLVALELKLNKFRHAYKSQMELYLRWLEKYEMNEGEESPIGLILCTGKSDEMIELLQLDEGSIRVAQYLTQLPSKEIFKKKLHDAIKKAKSLIENCPDEDETKK